MTKSNKKTDPVDLYPYLVYSSEPDAVQEPAEEEENDDGN